MRTEARCENCNRLLGKLEIPETFFEFVQTCNVSTAGTVFSVQCPRCKRINSIKLMPNA